MEITEQEYQSGLRADSHNDKFIEKRHRQRLREEGARPEEAAFMETARVRHKRDRLERLWDRLRHHESMIRAHTATHQAIIARHRAEVERLERELGITSEATQKGAA